MKAEMKFYEWLWMQLEVIPENDIEKYALTNLFAWRQPDFIVIK